LCPVRQWDHVPRIGGGCRFLPREVRRETANVSVLAEPLRTLFLKMKYRSVDHGPGISLAAVAIIIVISAVALKYLGS
jgi:hypothetical protein